MFCESLSAELEQAMTRVQTLVCSVCLIFVAVAPATADTTAGAPRSLRMRTPRATRVAQPTPDQPPGGDPPAPTPEPTPTADPQAPAPEPAAPAAEATAAPTSTA